MVKSCAAINCTNRCVKGTNITFYGFPHKNPELLQKWLQVMRRKNFQPTAHHYLCSEHFTEDCFLKSYVLCKKLVGDAVPSLFDFSEHLVKGRGQRKKVAKEILETYDETCPTPSPGGQAEYHESGNVLADTDTNESQASETDRLKKEIREAHDEVCKLRSQLICSQQHNRSTNATLNALKLQVRELKKKKMYKKVLHQKVRDILKTFFSDNQIKLLLDKKKRVNWHTKEVVQASTLHCMSKEVYALLRDKLNYPLPCISVLHRWASRRKVNDQST